MQHKINKCSGCKACENICPVGCLKIHTLDKYHFIKELDEKKCIKCGKCITVCPMKRGELHAPIQGLIAWSKSPVIAKNSASGGVAATIYNYCIENQRVCVGVHFEDSQRLVYDFLHTKEDISKAVGSKYVYSDMNDIYQRIESYLRNCEEVVFIGLPCHVSGLKNYCKGKNIKQELLYTIDIVCHGVPMPHWFKQHIKRICGAKSNIKDFYFRKKDNPYGLTILKDGKVVYKKEKHLEEYMTIFSKGYCTEGCFRCPYATGKRCSDITLKDCSAGDDVWQQIKGRPLYGNASEVLLNTKKGIRLFEEIKDKNLTAWDAKIEAIISEDPRLRYPIPRPRLYKIFTILEKKIGFRYTVWGLYSLYMLKLYIRKQFRSVRYKYFYFSK